MAPLCKGRRERAAHIMPSLESCQPCVKGAAYGTQWLPCVKGAVPKGLRDCLLRRSERLAEAAIPPSRLRRATSLYTREAGTRGTYHAFPSRGRWQPVGLTDEVLALGNRRAGYAAFPPHHPLRGSFHSRGSQNAGRTPLLPSHEGRKNLRLSPPSTNKKG